MNEYIMEKLKCHTPDLTAENIHKIAVLFPNCVLEAKDPQGWTKHFAESYRTEVELAREREREGRDA